MSNHHHRNNSNSNGGAHSSSNNHEQRSLLAELEAELTAVNDEIRRRISQYQHLKPHHPASSTSSSVAQSLAFQLLDRTAAQDRNAVREILERSRREGITLFSATGAATTTAGSEHSGGSNNSSIAGQPSRPNSASLPLPGDTAVAATAPAATTTAPLTTPMTPGNSLSNFSRFDQRDIDGQTPLHIAASKGDTFIARLLLEYGLQPDALDDADLTPLDVAREAGHTELADLLQISVDEIEREKEAQRQAFLQQQQQIVMQQLSQQQQQQSQSQQAQSQNDNSSSSDGPSPPTSTLTQGNSNITTSPATIVRPPGILIPPAPGWSAGPMPWTPLITRNTNGSITSTVSTPASAISASLLACRQFPSNSFIANNNSHQDIGITIGEERLNGVIILVGLPARGKTYFARRVQRFFMFKGAEITSFSAGDARRRLYPNLSRSNISDTQAERVSDELARIASRFLGEHRSRQHCAAIIDGLNHSRALRARLFTGLCSHGVPPTSIVFLEVVVTDDKLIEHHIATAVMDYIIGDRNLQPSHFGAAPQQQQQLQAGTHPSSSSSGAGPGGKIVSFSSSDDPMPQHPSSQHHQQQQQLQHRNHHEVSETLRFGRRPTMLELRSAGSPSPNASPHHQPTTTSGRSTAAGTPSSTAAAAAVFVRGGPKALMQSESVAENALDGDDDDDSGDQSDDDNDDEILATKNKKKEAAATAKKEEEEQRKAQHQQQLDDDELAKAFTRKYRGLIAQMQRRYETMTEEHEAGLCFARSVNRSQLKCHNMAYTPIGRALSSLLIDIHENDKRYFLATIGETVAQSEQRYGQHATSQLTAKGVEYSNRLANYLAEHIPPSEIANDTTIFTCAAPAARQTVAPILAKLAEIANRERDAAADAATTTTATAASATANSNAATPALDLRSTVRYLHTLDDLNYGDMDGMTRAEAMQAFPRHMRNMAENPYSCEFPRGESFSQMMQLRLEQHISELEAVTRANIILVVPTPVAQALMLYFDPARYPSIRPEQAVRVEIPAGSVICLTGSDREAPEWHTLV